VSGARRLLRGFILVATTAVAAVALAGAASSGSRAVVTVRVDARDFSFTLSRRSVPAGTTVRFVVRNRGSTVHDFAIAGKRTRLLGRGRSQTISLRFNRRGRFRFVCTVPGHARLGMRGRFAVGRPAPPATPPAPPPPVTVSDTVVLTRIGTFERPLLVTAPPGDTDRLVVVEQEGAVRVVRDGEVLPTPFLDLRGQVKLSSEPGLLSVAFSPDYAESGLLYVFYNTTAGNGDIRIAEYRRHPIDPDLTEPYADRTLLTIPKPWENHNGGMLQFGPDGYLYASIGDGDSGVYTPPGYFAQRLDSLLGTILRIDPRGDPYTVPDDNPFVGLDGVRPEIWAYGLRNPWRFWIDPETSDLYLGDAGNERREEIDLVEHGASGLNFGWPCFEGTLPFDSDATCDGAVPPLLEISREAGACAVIGGVVVRDPRVPVLEGRYLYGDFCAGTITALEVEDGRVTASDDLGLVVPQLSSFGVDGSGRVYVAALDGPVYRLDPKPSG
jgi:glucose/arabinose dehydrogenase